MFSIGLILCVIALIILTAIFWPVDRTQQNSGANLGAVGIIVLVIGVLLVASSFL